MSDDQEAPRHSLLPANRSAIEAALDFGFAKLLERIDPPFPQLMNPMATPVDFLSYLAADRGVLGWSPTASEPSKRATVQASWSTKRLAGTRKGLRLALETTGFAPRFVPWYEVGAEPYTLLIVATSDANQSAGDYQNLGYRLEEAMSERDRIVIKVEKKITLEQRLYLAQYMRQASHLGVLPESIVVTPSDTPLCIATALHSARVWTLRTMTEVAAASAQQFSGGALHTATIIRIEAING